MSPLLIALLGVLLLPLFVGSWRTSLLGLSCQGILMSWIAFRMGPPPQTASDWLVIADLVIVRGLFAPLALRAVLLAHKSPARNDVIPPNLLSWTFAFGIVLVAFNFSERLVPMHGEQQTLLAVATAGLLLGFLVLATQSGPFSQIIGIIRIENAIALFELGGPHHREAFLIHLALVAALIASIAFYRWYLQVLNRPAEAAEDSGPSEMPSL